MKKSNEPKKSEKEIELIPASKEQVEAAMKKVMKQFSQALKNLASRQLCRNSS